MRGLQSVEEEFGFPLPQNTTYSEVFHQTEWIEWSTISITACMNFCVALSCFFVFWSWRKHHPSHFSLKRKRLPRRTPSDLSIGFLSWIAELLVLPEQKLLAYAGFDALIFVRFYKMAFKIFALFLFYGLAAIIPVNIAGGQSTSGEVQTSINSFNQLSMSNIKHYDSRMWIHVAGMYLLTFIVHYFLYLEFRFYKQLRHEYLMERSPHLRTVIVEEVPSEMRQVSKIFNFFNTLYPNAVERVYIPQKINKLKKLIEERKTVLRKLERYIFLKRLNGEEHYQREGICGCGESVNSISYYESKLKALNAEISKEQMGRQSSYQTIQMAPVSTLNEFFSQLPNEEQPQIKRGSISLDWTNSKVRRFFLDQLGAGPIERRVLATDDDVSSDSYGSGNNYTIKPSTPQFRLRCNAMSPYMQPERPELLQGSFDIQDTTPISELFYAVHKRSYNFSDYNSDEEEEELIDADEFISDKTEMTNHESMPLFSRKVRKIRKVMANRAFVTFNSFAAATTAIQVLHCSIPGRMRAVPAPEPRDVCWQNIIVSRKMYLFRWLLVEAVLFALMVFFPLIVTLMSYVISADQLCKNSTLINDAIELVQPICLLVLMSTLPALLRLVGMVEGNISHSIIQKKILSRLFQFQVINVFLVTTVAGSLIDVFGRIINHPSDSFTLLGETLPKVAGFFCDYVIIKTFSTMAMELIRFPAFLQSIIRGFLVSDSTRDADRIVLGIRAYDNPGSFNYGKKYAQDLLVFTLIMTYACVAPVIIVPGLLFFIMAQVVYRHQLLFVYVPDFESGGAFFPLVFRRCVFAVFAAQATLMGMFLLKNGLHQVYATSLLMVLTYFYKVQMRSLYEPIAKSLPLEIATALDIDYHVQASEKFSASFTTAPSLIDAEYIQPELIVPAHVKPNVEFNSCSHYPYIT